MSSPNPHPPRGSRFPVRLIILSALLFVPLCPFSISAQEPEDVIRVRTDLVAVPLVVTDSRGRRVSGLQTEDFALHDDTRAARIDYFASGTDRVALLFALDASGSAREIVTQQREAAMALFSRFGRGSRVAVLHFGESVRLSAGFSSTTEVIEQAFNAPAQATQGTAIFDGAIAGLHAFDGRGGFSTERRIVILISDGLDTRSATTYRAVIDAARVHGISFYVIHFPLFSPRDGQLEPRPPSKGFRELAEQTGGRYFRIGDVQSALNPHRHYDLTNIFQAIDDDLRGQYVIGFYPSDAARDGQTHTVTVSLSSTKRRMKVIQVRRTYNLKP
jgi:Ca-activated chloride channel family protein